MKRSSEKLRIKTTWFFGVVLCALVLFSEPAAETISPFLEGSLMLSACVFAAIGAFGRLWASIYVVGYKDSRLITVGPYSLCRNPLYFFSFIGAVGVGLATETLTIPAIIAGVFLLYYPSVILAEEKRLEELFGSEYETYKKTTPSVLPKFERKIVQPETWSVVPKKLTRRILDSLWFVFFIGFIEFAEELRAAGIVPELWRLY